MATCRDCKLFDIEAAKDKAGRVQSQWYVRCLWESKEQYPVALRFGSSRPQAGRTNSNAGKGCKCFQNRSDENG